MYGSLRVWGCACDVTEEGKRVKANAMLVESPPNFMSNK
jgi:hypothetical protein